MFYITIVSSNQHSPESSLYCGECYKPSYALKKNVVCKPS